MTISSDGGAARPLLVLALATAALAFGIAMGLSVGRYAVPVERAIAIVLANLGNPLVAPEGINERIIWLVRAPRVALAAISGAGLAIAGVALQGVFRNPLVSPEVLGISQGAAFGGALAIVLGLAGVQLLLLAFLAGLAALALVGGIARIDGRTEIMTVILSGMVVGALFFAFVSLLQYVADPNATLPAIVYWLMGSFAAASWQQVLIAAPGIGIGAAVLWGMRFRLNLLSLDETEAQSLGARPDRERWLVFAMVAVIVGAQVAVSGIIGWIGLVIPHLSRLLVGHDHRRLLPAAAILGAAYLVAVDTLARTASSAELPLGVLTAIVGAPMFALLLRRSFGARERGA